MPNGSSLIVVLTLRSPSILATVNCCRSSAAWCQLLLLLLLLFLVLIIAAAAAVAVAAHFGALAGQGLIFNNLERPYKAL